MSFDFDRQAVEHFKEYLRIPSLHPDVDYSPCVEFVKQRASDLGLKMSVVEVMPRKPVAVVHWKGRAPQLPSLLLSSHMDVVPVYASQWAHPPFGAEEDMEGNIYARGAQDMKCVAVQYLEAVNRLIAQGYQPNRTVHICFTPDEEIGCLGMKAFVDTEEFRELNVGCMLDEGIATPGEDFVLFYGERTRFSFKIICPGTTGHGSLLLENTAGEKIKFVIDKMMEKRAEEKYKLKLNSKLNLADVTTINLAMIEGGVQTNVVPPELTVTFDCRLTVDTDPEAFTEWIENMCKQAGEGVRAELPTERNRTNPTKLDASNPWWTALDTQFKSLGMKVNTRISPANSDSRYIRNLGIPAFGFSPMNYTHVKLHDHDEYLNRKVFLKGIEIYSSLISALANL